MSDQNMLAELVNDSLVHAMSADLGVGSELPEAQAEAISKIGKAIMERVTLELLKALPVDAHGQFLDLLESGDTPRFEEFLRAHIKDLDGFVQRESTQEYEKIKVRADEIARARE
ncbi:MAG: hypothetical protein AAB734_00180 [Patescibacteria group bacterium]